MRIIIAFTVLMIATSTQAIKFHSYINDEGKTVFSNVPKNCVNQSVLTCLQYHPVISTDNRDSKSNGVDTKNRSNQTTTLTGHPGRNINSRFQFQQRSNETGRNHEFDVLNRVVEMNKLINDYFPGNGSSSDANQVRQQQNNILEVIQVIRKAANPEERQSIDHAIDIFRSNRIE